MKSLTGGANEEYHWGRVYAQLASQRIHTRAHARGVLLLLKKSFVTLLWTPQPRHTVLVTSGMSDNEQAVRHRVPRYVVAVFKNGSEVTRVSGE